MDFVIGFPKTVKGHDAIWVIIDRLTKSTHFIPICSTYSMDRYAQLYIQEVVRIHGVLLSIVSDRDSRFNNSYQATIGMVPYEVLYGRKCRSPVHWDDIGERKLLGPDMIREMMEAVTQIRQRMETAQSRQKSYSDQRRRMLEFSIGDQVFLKVAPMKGVMRFEKKGKLSPRYIGPFHIRERIGDVAYRLDLPASMSQIHDVFHVSMLRKYVSNPSHILKHEPVELKADLSYEEVPVEILLQEVKKLRNKEIPLVKVL
ncbi:hypothetical protein DH2020_020546 [Rehmannia glutinosa]|uniref:Tf2-1-like SH3-like domain-containing protein n=1 Tax=Rehmannia glutinosa TaxID=99300 RepID=A0ABR0WGY3_REHGL